MVNASIALSGMTKPVTLTRRAAGSYVNGRWIEGAATETTIDAYIEPAPGSEIMTLPEGERGKEAILIITTTELKTLIEGTPSQSADYILWQGKNFKVIKVSPYSMGVLDNYEAIAVRENP